MLMTFVITDDEMFQNTTPSDLFDQLFVTQMGIGYTGELKDGFPSDFSFSAEELKLFCSGQLAHL